MKTMKLGYLAVSKASWMTPKIAAIAAVACFGLVWAALVGLRTLQIKQKERLDGLAVHGEL